MMEACSLSVEEISVVSGYNDSSFFRWLFKRLTGLTPSQNRRAFQPIGTA